MKQIHIISCILILSLTAKAQHSRLQVGLGYQRIWMVDKQASPLKYQSSQKTFLIGYERESVHAKFTVNIDGAIGDFFPAGFTGRLWYNPGYNGDGTPKKDSSVIKGRLYNGRIKLGYLSALPGGHSKIGNNSLYTREYIGGSLSNQLFYSDNIIRTGWLNSTSVNADYSHAMLMNTRHRVDVKVSIPLFARNSRLPYHNTIGSENGDSHIKTFFKQGSRFTSVIDFQNIQMDATYEYALSKKLGIGIHYSGQWLHYSYEKPVTLFQSNIGITASVK